MIIFSVLIALIVIMYPICNKTKTKRGRAVYCIIVFILMTLVMGLRSRYTAGVDTNLVYLPSFHWITDHSMSQVMLRYEDKDPLFYMLTKLFTYMISNDQIYLMVISVISVGSYCIFVYKNSENPLMSYILYMGLGYYGIEFQMLRHAIAVSILLCGYKFLKERKAILFIMIVLLASCFHNSALIFMIAYPISYLKIDWKQWVVLTATVIIVYCARDTVLSIIGTVILNEERYQNYMSGNTGMAFTGAIIQLLIYVLCFIMSLGKRSNDMTMYLNISVVSIAFMFCVSIIGEFHRISMFFGMYNTIMLPKVIHITPYLKDNRNKFLLNMAICVVFIFYFFFAGVGNAGLQDYKFFWQSVY